MEPIGVLFIHPLPVAEVGTMSVISEIHANLDAISLEQQGCVFAFLMSYPLTLGALLDLRGRRIAASVSAASVVCFAFFTDPWFHAVLIMALVVGLTGVFIVAVTIIDRLARAYAFRGVPVDDVEFVDDDSIIQPTASPAVNEPERLPIVAIVSLKH